ncbi:MAG: hypothetical protein AAB870_04470 [Patescibacteria group bacterium]
MPFKNILTRHQWLRVGLFSAIGAPVIALFLAVYLIWFSPHFVIDYVEINGANGLDMSAVRRLVFSQMDTTRYYIFPQRNVWFFDNEAAQHAIWEEYAISQLSIEKQSPNTMKISVFEEPFQAIWYTKGKYYKVDGRGIIIKEVDADLLSTIPYPLPAADNLGVIAPIKTPSSKEGLKAPSLLFIQDSTNADASSGMAVMSSHTVEAMGMLKEKLAAQHIEPYYIITKPREHDIEIITTQQWAIRLNVFERVDEQIDHLRVVLQQRVDKERNELQYVDVRFDNRIYIKKK